MRARVSASLTKRVDTLARRTRGVDRDKRYQLATILGPQILTAEDVRELTPWQYTVLTWPPILSIDEWEALAADTQEKLVRETGEYLGPPVTITAPDPADVSERYKPDKFRGAITDEEKRTVPR